MCWGCCTASPAYQHWRALHAPAGSHKCNAAALPAPPLLPCATLPCPAGSSKRDYVRWAPEEEAAFFEALRGVAGQKPEKCLKEIVARVGTKDYAQVGGWGVTQGWQDDQPSAVLTPAAAGLVSSAQLAHVLPQAPCTAVSNRLLLLVLRCRRCATTTTA